MLRFIQYYGRFQDVKGRFGGLPSWAKWPIFIAAIPGVLLALLSLLALGVSILALLLLTVPTYRLMQWLTGSGGGETIAPTQESVSVEDVFVSPEPKVNSGRRHIDVKIIDS